MSTGYRIIWLCPQEPSHTHAACYQTCTGLFVAKEETENMKYHLCEGSTSCFSSDLIPVMHQRCMCKVRKIQFKCKGERAGGETYLWKIITSEKIWSWLPVPNILRHFVIASPQPLRCQIAAIFPAIMKCAAQGREESKCDDCWEHLKAFHWAPILWG